MKVRRSRDGIGNLVSLGVANEIQVGRGEGEKKAGFQNFDAKNKNVSGLALCFWVFIPLLLSRQSHPHPPHQFTFFSFLFLFLSKNKQAYFSFPR